ncbi:hypothetical protein J5N97_027632 [Dioscorea zingiberensis]|uniref:Uncharacterized protein n=1 Tax=Dioscorea zingiberensis TaxID=325984 RepID=A0A9D5BXG9_9LILI|nr:hypothetical protein J5N97_027632 [Dioscorea zingiberensis]
MSGERPGYSVHDEASLSKRSYDVALLALQEVFRKVSQVNSITRDNRQHCYSQNGNCYKVSEEAQSCNSVATHVLSEPQVPDTLETPQRSGVENGASWPNEERN